MNSPRTPDSRWVLRSRGLLDRDAEQLDPVLLRRLGMARQQALERDGPSALHRLAMALSVTGVVASLLLMVIGLQRPALPPGSVDGPVLVAPGDTGLRVDSALQQVLSMPEDDLDLIARPDDYALLDELEFYAWLKQGDQDG